ncbi:hypothetical protein [Spiroplasma ixodetis]|uniref:hypothetical protein n=1 Tax=Spiroplasma ixodetis TaxID=2141 RepID=UPI0025789FD7|nr:hypothetical protein [Spiroplasma ixodetis]WJG69993.1 hypothetical protein SIXOD_v1c10060 [Spiroplasma ixodetis Y32]
MSNLQRKSITIFTRYLQDGKIYGEIKKETGISKTTIWIWKQKARKNEFKTKHSVNSAPRDILEEATNIAEINCDNNKNQNYKEEFLVTELKKRLIKIYYLNIKMLY